MVAAEFFSREIDVLGIVEQIEMADKIVALRTAAPAKGDAVSGWWSRHWPTLLWRTRLVYPFLFLLKLIEGNWHAKRHAKNHPERGI